MPERAVYLLVVEGFADWEPAHAVAELRRHGQYRVESVGLTSAPVQSMGGIRVLPSTTVGEVDPLDVAVFILPGGDRWETALVEPEIAQLLAVWMPRGFRSRRSARRPSQSLGWASCEGVGTRANGLDYFRSHVPGYTEAANYVDVPAVRDRGLITASGVGDVEFARELFEELNVLSAEDR